MNFTTFADILYIIIIIIIKLQAELEIVLFL